MVQFFLRFIALDISVSFFSVHHLYFYGYFFLFVSSPKTYPVHSNFLVHLLIYFWVIALDIFSWFFCFICFLFLFLILFCSFSCLVHGLLICSVHLPFGPSAYFRLKFIQFILFSIHFLVFGSFSCFRFICLFLFLVHRPIYIFRLIFLLVPSFLVHQPIFFVHSFRLTALDISRWFLVHRLRYILFTPFFGSLFSVHCLRYIPSALSDSSPFINFWFSLFGS